ncbi:MAG TPA: HAMP domain-containing sensor histidine kinase [Actinomycetota bacterium]|nr:HAMP domain-containing sensor histidine kinase [Actinomycetota bacterium]
MIFRQRLTLVSAGAVAVAVAVASVAVWFVVRSELRSQVDHSLIERAAFVKGIRIPVRGRVLPALQLGPGEPLVYFQVITPNGDVLRTENGPSLALPPADVQAGEVRLDDRTADGVHYRVYTEALGTSGYTLLLARPLTEVDSLLRRMMIVLAFVAGGGIAIAAGLGLVVTRAAVGPVARLTEAAERVTETRDLSHRIEEPGQPSDEIGRLASSFNAMLEALEGSVTAQRQLVSDASHELRTPLTSVRTNIDLLASGRPLDPIEREQLISDVRVQLEELTVIVNDLVELARGAEQLPVFEEIRLDEVVRDAVDRFRRRAPTHRVQEDLDPVVVRGDAPKISRAVGNLLDNAARWSDGGGGIEISVRGPVVSVRDRGPGFAAEDLPHVFDRFYRAASARRLPGSGLGLAIVRQVAETHGGRASADNHPEGGAIVRLELSPVALPDPPARGDAPQGMP